MLSHTPAIPARISRLTRLTVIKPSPFLLADG
jgi:hypothetical protein